MAFKGYSKSIRGASHESNGKPCQDYAWNIVRKDYAVAAVSDGHGSPRYYRSDIGSKLAVEAARDVVTSLMDNERGEFIAGLGNDPDGILTRVTDAVLTRWTDAVHEYDIKHPPSEKELSLDDAEGERDVLRAYGATLICGVMSDDVVFGFQIGDGALVAVNDDSEETMPMPDDPDCFLNRTSSICGSDASVKFRHFVISAYVENWKSENFCSIHAEPTCVTSISVCTDGLSTSFNSDDSLKRYCSAVPAVLSSGDDVKLLDNLSLRSRSNTCDDVSLSVVYRVERNQTQDVTGKAKDCSVRKSRKNRQKRKERRCGRR